MENDSENPKIHYYDMGLDEYKARTKDPNDTPPYTELDNDLRQARNNYRQTTPNAIRLHKTDHSSNSQAPLTLKAQLLIRDDVFVQPTTETSEFNFLSERGFIDGPPVDATTPHPGDLNPDATYDSNSIQFQFVPRHEGEATFTCPGDVSLNSKVHGYGGAITSESDITLSGAGALAAQSVNDGGDGLSLYAKGDVNINTYRAVGNKHYAGRYADMNLRGVVYAWGDVNFRMGPPENDTTDPNFYYSNGYLRMNGAVVAYGGNPGDAANPEPGSGSGGIGPDKGNINIDAHYALLRFNPKYLLSLDKLASPSDYAVVSYTLHRDKNPTLR